jgi:predicted metal-dependent hydrolase
MKRSSQHIFYVEDQTIPYTLHRKSGQKHKYIHIKNGKVLITAPYMSSLRSIEALIADKYTWIIRHTSVSIEKNDPIKEGAHIWYHGSKYEIKQQAGDANRLILQDQTAVFVLAEAPSSTLLQNILQEYYRSHASDHIMPRVEYWSEAMDLKPAKVSFRKAYTRWGSCSSVNNISLNIYLVMLPDELMDYVLVHELAHIKHKNHSKQFWNLVEQYIPDWKHTRRLIHTFEKHLV